MTSRSELSGEPLIDPVLFRGKFMVERAAAVIRQKGNSLFDPSLENPAIEPVNGETLSLIRRTASRTSQLILLDGTASGLRLLTQSLGPSPWVKAIDMANIELQIHAPLSLQQAVTPALTLDAQGHVAVYISRDVCAPAGQDISLLRPCHGEVRVDVNIVAIELQPIIEARKRAGEWDYDAFGTTRTDKVDTRTIEEAIVVTLDLSRSMQQDFNPPDDDITRDPDVIAAETCLEHFGKRGITMIDALQSGMFAYVFFDHLYLLLNSRGEILYCHTGFHT